MYSNQRIPRQPIGFGAGGPPPRDVLILLGVLLFTYSLGFFETTAGFVRSLMLSRGVWNQGQLWQVVTYPFVGYGGFLFLLTLLITFWFGRDVYNLLGRRHFWRLIAWATITSALVAIAVDFLLILAGIRLPAPFVLMQGSEMLLTILVSAFATLYRNATILLMFVLPIKARWFLWLAIIFAFMGFLPTKDFAGFVGVCVAVGVTYSMLTAGSLRKAMREYRLRLERRYLEFKMQRSRRRFRVVKSKDDNVHRGPWIN